ncbi:MAG TPA: HU family DNA-binding protein [Acidimicrobiales bacterium]
MNRRELVKAVAEYTGQEIKSVDAALRGFETVVAASVGRGEPVVLSGFAKFARVDRKARMGRNPATGEPVRIKASRKARITALKGLKDIVGGKAPVPKLTPAKATATKATAKKTAAKKAATKATARKAAAKKAAPAKRTAKKTTAKKATKRTAKKR